jgi:hypothetical protein
VRKGGRQAEWGVEGNLDVTGHITVDGDLQVNGDLLAERLTKLEEYAQRLSKHMQMPDGGTLLNV